MCGVQKKQYLLVYYSTETDCNQHNDTNYRNTEEIWPVHPWGEEHQDSSSDEVSRCHEHAWCTLVHYKCKVCLTNHTVTKMDFEKQRKQN